MLRVLGAAARVDRPRLARGRGGGRGSPSVFVAGSVALAGFGADSLIEAEAGVVVLWLHDRQAVGVATAERRAQQLIAASFASWRPMSGPRPSATSSQATTPGELGRHRPGRRPRSRRCRRSPSPSARVGERLGSSATASESRQTMLCAYLSPGAAHRAARERGAGWWWADPLVALAIAGVAVREARDAWRGDACGCCA